MEMLLFPLQLHQTALHGSLRRLIHTLSSSGRGGRQRQGRQQLRGIPRGLYTAKDFFLFTRSNSQGSDGGTWIARDSKPREEFLSLVG
jgi:hypothetical protein